MKGRNVRCELVGAFAQNDRKRCAHENLDIHPGRPGASIAEIEPNHLIKRHATASTDLPKSGDPRLCFEQPPAMPHIVILNLIGNRRTRAYQRHLAFQYVVELRQFIQAGPAQKTPDTSDPRIFR